MGGASKGGQTVGFKYYMGAHFVLCQSPIDSVTAIRFQDSMAWQGGVKSGRINIDQPNLFGGKGKEGGVSGFFDILDGNPAQPVNDYLAAKAAPSTLSSAIGTWLSTYFPKLAALRSSAIAYGAMPAFRGVVSAVMRGMYIGNNPFLKPLRFKTKNIYSTFGDWLPDYAPIGDAASVANTALYIALDVSQYDQEYYAKVVAALKNTLNAMVGSRNSIHLAMFAGSVVASAEVLNATTQADYNTIINTLTSFTATGSTAPNISGCDFGAALAGMNTFFAAAKTADANGFVATLSGSSFISGSQGDATLADSMTYSVLFISGGVPNPTSSATTAYDTVVGSSYHPNVFCINVGNTDTTYTGPLDNTAQDGIPVVGDKRDVLFQDNMYYKLEITNPATSAPLVDLRLVLNLTTAQLANLLADQKTVLEANLIATCYTINDPLIVGASANQPAQMSNAVEVIFYDINNVQIVGYPVEITFLDYGMCNMLLSNTIPANAVFMRLGAGINPTLASFDVTTIDKSHYKIYGSGVEVNPLNAILSSAVGDWVDINPAHVLRDIILSPLSGGDGDATKIGASFEAAAITLYNENFGISIENKSPSDRETFKTQIESHINGQVYVDDNTGLWEIKLIRDDYDVTTLPVFDSSTIMSFPEPPVRPMQDDLPNQINLVYTDRQVPGGTKSVTITNSAAVQLIGSVIQEKVEYPGITVETLANTVASRELSARTIPLYTGSIQVTNMPTTLNFGSPFIINYPEYGLYNLVCRVTGFERASGKDDSSTIKFTQDVYTMAVTNSAGTITTNTTTPAPATQFALPPNVELVEEAPYWARVMSETQPTVDSELSSDPGSGYMMATCDKPSSTHIDAILVRNDAGTWKETSSVVFAPYTTLSENLDDLASSTQFKAPYNASLSQISKDDILRVDKEYMRVDNLAIDSTGTVVTFTVGRGVMDTVPAPHAVGAGVICWYPFASGDTVHYTAGESIQYELLPRTNSDVAKVAAVAPVTVTFADRAISPYPAGKVQVSGLYGGLTTAQSGSLTMTWAHRDRILQTTTTPEDFTAANIGPEAGVGYSVVRRTRQEWTNFFAQTNVFAEEDFFVSDTAGTELVTALTGTPTTDSVSVDDINFFSWANFFGQTDFYEGAYLADTLALDLSVRVARGGFTNLQEKRIRVPVTVPPNNITATVV